MSEDIEIEDIDDDSEDSKGTKSSRKDDLASVFAGVLGMINIKSLIAIFLIFLFISSNVFIDKVLGNIDGASEHMTASTKGIFIQGLALVVMYMIIDLLLQAGLP